MSDDGLEPLRRRFWTRCADDLEVFRTVRNAARGLSDPAIASIIHRLSGLAGSLGYDELGRLARIVDDCLMEAAAPDPTDVDGLERELSRVAALARP